MPGSIAHHNTIHGMFYMLIHVLAISLVYTVMKLLVQDINSSLAVFLYKSSILLMLLPILIIKGKPMLRTNYIGLHAFRAAVSVFGALSLFHAIKYISMADVIAVQYLEYVFMMIVGILYFNERFSKTKCAIIICSLFGSFIVIKAADLQLWWQGEVPLKVLQINYYYFFIFFTLICWTTNSTLIKILGRTETGYTQMLYSTLFSCILSAPLALCHWELNGWISLPTHIITWEESKLNAKHFAPIMLLGALYFLHCITHFHALKRIDLSTAGILEYARLPCAAILGYCFFNDTFNAWQLLGYILIIFSGIHIAHRERRKYKKTIKSKEEL